MGSVLLNAEPFGYGPAAAMAQLAARLKGQVSRLGYVGSGHTLHLQLASHYSDRVEVSLQQSSMMRAELQRLRNTYTHFLTACDFEAAGLASAAGYEVGIYDPLAWFWRSLPASVVSAQCYIVQNFFGVDERIERWRAMLPSKTHVVPLLVQAGLVSPATQGDGGILVNLGGLSNPFTSSEVLLNFARCVVEACRVAAGDNDIVLAGNRDICTQTSAAMLSNATPHNVQQRLQGSRLAIMTPGLGNLTAAAAAATPVIWLPPANDSQGQQLKLLQQNDLIDACVDWHDFTGCSPIDYFMPQAQVMTRIDQSMKQLSGDAATCVRFGKTLENRVHMMLSRAGKPRLTHLIDLFGSDGVASLTAVVQQWIGTR